MPILSESDLFIITPSDLDNKVYAPTRELYAAFSSKLNNHYDSVKDYLINLHADIAVASQQLYDQPEATFTSWCDQAVQESVELYTEFNQKILPSINQDYQRVLAETQNLYQDVSDQVIESSVQMQQMLQIFMQDPALVSVQSYNSMETLGSELWAQIQTDMLHLSSYVANSSSELIDHPDLYLDAVMYEIAAIILSYYESTMHAMLSYMV